MDCKNVKDSSKMRFGTVHLTRTSQCIKSSPFLLKQRYLMVRVILSILKYFSLPFFHNFSLFSTNFAA